MRGRSIRTPDQRLRVFVSSTLSELAAERAAVREAIERLQLTPVLFELGARPHPPRDLYRAYLEQSQIFVGIYWQRYGWVAPDETVSGLEDEYRLSVGMPRLLYVKAPAPDREPLLQELLERIQSDDTASYKPFQTPEELARLVSADLALLLSERFMSPATMSEGQPSRASNRPHHNLPVQLSSLVGRDADLATVKRALADSRLVTLTGVGGAGKSRLALQAAGDMLHEYADGAWLVELARCRNRNGFHRLWPAGSPFLRIRTGHRPRRWQSNCDQDSSCSLSITASTFWPPALASWPAC